MIRSLKSKTAGVAAVGVLALGGAAGAYAATSGSNAPTPLTGNITDKAADAALAKYPGATLVGIESEPNGSFEARVRKSDGSDVELTLDRDFTVTATHAGGGWEHGGPGGPQPFGAPGGRGAPGPPFDTAALARSLGVTEAQLRDALDQIRPDRGGPAGPPPAPPRGQAPPAPRGHAPGRGRPGPRAHDADLAAALAKQLNIDVDKVRAALEANRPPRHP
ncbi:MAG TPA: Clp protease N-terminal domain-containing protein [Conexibacter sp.]|jgi:hypothetical protein